jgi:hypothetical protein
MSIEAAIPGDRNVVKREAKKVPKYKDLVIDIVECGSKSDSRQ